MKTLHEQFKEETGHEVFHKINLVCHFSEKYTTWLECRVAKHEVGENNTERVTPIELIELIESLPDAELHIHEFEGKQYVTQEWLCGAFAGRSFEADTTEAAAEKMIQYLYDHIGHKSIVGECVTSSGFPDLERVKNYCLESIEAA